MPLRRLILLALATTPLAAQPNFVLRSRHRPGTPAIEIAAARIAKDDAAQVFGRYRIAADGGTLRSLSDGAPNWTAHLADGQRVGRLVAAGHRGLVLPADEKGQPLPLLRVLDLGSGTWLQDLTPTPLAAPLRRIMGHAVIVERERVALLSFAGGEQTTHAVVDAFTLGRSEPTWSRTLPLAMPLGTAVPNARDAVKCAARPGDQALQWLGECLLVAPTSRDPLHLLSPHSGRTVWSVERVWEFARGFVGPSVWGHTLGRLGLDGPGEPDANYLAELRMKLDARWVQFIDAGPVVVRRRGRDTDDNPLNGAAAFSVFVVTGRVAAEGSAGEAEFTVHELNEAGRAVAIGDLPLPVHDGSHRATTDRVTWQTESGGMVCMAAAAFGAGSPSMGSDNPDRLVHIAWLRQFESARHGKFLKPAQWREPPALANQALFWRADHNDDAPCTQIHATLLSDGATGDWQVLSTDGAATTVQRLSAQGDTLAAHVVHQAEAYRVEFHLTGHAAFGPTAAEREAEGADALQTARAMLKQGRKNAPDQSPLFDAVGSSDTRVLRALLELGADPKAKSPSNWTPLMYAACYGSAEAVEALIPASDLAAQDNNCGGQSVLIWATRSNRQSHRKVRTLLDAGADPNLATPDDWSPLMSAAAAGNLLGVELLLTRGADATRRNKNGKTAADWARERGYPAIAEVLEAATGKSPPGR